MKQSDQFGNFNHDIGKYNRYIAHGITTTADILRDHLLELSSDRIFYDTDGYINEVIEGYRQFVHMLHSFSRL